MASSWCEPFPVSRGEELHGACTGLVGGPGSYKSPPMRYMQVSSEVSNVLQAVSLHTIGELDEEEERPRPRVSEDELLATARKTRFICKGRSEVVPDKSICGAYSPKPRLPRSAHGILEELVPGAQLRGAPDADKERKAEGDKDIDLPQSVHAAASEPGVATDTVRKCVRWCENLVEVREFERASSHSSSSAQHEEDDPNDRPPRLPSSTVGLLTELRPRGPKGACPIGAQSSEQMAAARPGAHKTSSTEDGTDKPRLPRRASDLLCGLAVPSSQRRICGPDWMGQLGEKGLLPVVWPAERVLMGMCVNKQLLKELPLCNFAVLFVRPGGSIPAPHVLNKFKKLAVRADTVLPPPPASERTRSIKSFMKSLVSLDNDVQADSAAHASAAQPQTAARRKAEGVPLEQLRCVRHRIFTLDLANCKVGADGGVALSSLLYTYTYRSARCTPGVRADERSTHPRLPWRACSLHVCVCVCVCVCVPVGMCVYMCLVCVCVECLCTCASGRVSRPLCTSKIPPAHVRVCSATHAHMCTPTSEPQSPTSVTHVTQSPTPHRQAAMSDMREVSSTTWACSRRCT
jgi:hypothetical protein